MPTAIQQLNDGMEKVGCFRIVRQRIRNVSLVWRPEPFDKTGGTT